VRTYIGGQLLYAARLLPQVGDVHSDCFFRPSATTCSAFRRSG